MSNPRKELRCPHCNAVLQAFKMPDDAAWDTPYHWACFNDECPYFIDGWQWMEERYAVKASYRYRVVDRESETTSPLAVWSKTALCDLIVNEDEMESNR